MARNVKVFGKGAFTCVLVLENRSEALSRSRVQVQFGQEKVSWGSSVHVTAQAAWLFLSASAKEGWGQARDKWRLGLGPFFPSHFLQPDAEVEAAGSEAGVDSPGRLKGGKEGVPVTWGGSSRAALLSS